MSGSRAPLPGDPVFSFRRGGKLLGLVLGRPVSSMGIDRAGRDQYLVWLEQITGYQHLQTIARYERNDAKIERTGPDDERVAWITF